MAGEKKMSLEEAAKLISEMQDEGIFTKKVKEEKKKPKKKEMKKWMNKGEKKQLKALEKEGY